MKSSVEAGEYQRQLVVLVPGLAGGIDEAANYVFPFDSFAPEFAVHVLATRGRRAWLAPLMLMMALIRLVVWRVQGRLDLLHINIASRGSTLRKLAAATTAQLLRVPYMLQLHGGGYWSYYSNSGPVVRWLVRWLFARAERVFVLGEPFADVVTGPLGVTPAKVVTVRNAVPTTRQSSSTQSAEKPTHLLYTGRIHQAKGIDDLFGALDRVQHHKWTATIVGDGEVERAREQIESMQLDDRVTILGWQSREKIQQLLSEATIFVLPSYIEALSLSLLEAMSAGLCCITTDVGAHGELVTDNQNGVVVQPGNIDQLAEALDRTIGDASLCQKLGVAARETVMSQCSVEKVRGELARQYQDVLRPWTAQTSTKERAKRCR